MTDNFSMVRFNSYCMANTIHVFTTRELHDRDYCSAEKVKYYLSETFNNTGASADIVAREEHPNPPTEKIFDPIQQHPCTNIEANYDGLLPWWRDYYQDCTSWNDNHDSHILVTDATSLGGKAYSPGKFSVSAGRQVQDLACTTSTDSTGCTTAHDAVQTAIHEVGHNFGAVHKDGTADVYSSTYYETPMMNGYAESYDGTCDACTCIDTIGDQTHCLEYEFTNCTAAHL